MVRASHLCYILQGLTRCWLLPGISLLMMIVASIASGMTFGPTSDQSATIGTLCFFRFWLGFGVGGDYPLSATIMSEYSNKANRGGFVAAVFAMQGIGILTAAAVALIVTSIFKHAYPGTPFGSSVELIRGSCPREADYVWRIVLAFGALPAMLTMYARMSMPETPRFTLMVQGNAAKATADTSSVMNDGSAIAAMAKPPPPPMRAGAFLRAWWKPLLGCSMSWFLLDVAFYSQNLFQKDVFAAIGWIPKAEEMNALEETYLIARAQALIALGSTVPGYWFTVFTIDKLGRKPIQFGGFVLMTIFMAALSAWYEPLRDRHQAGFVTMYALTFFFSNFGPNATTFVLPAELFPTAWKSTAHGICAAAGKAGAIVGAFGFLYASQPADAAEAAPYPKGIGLRETLGLLAAVNFAGMWFTLLIPETKGKSLEELNGEDGLPSHQAASYAAADVALTAQLPAEQASAPPPAGV
jgi:PHS family inorganic phosphate transporter-like MFS transporter